MPQILFVHASTQLTEGRKEALSSYTRKMARHLKNRVKGRGVKVIERDIAANPPCMIDRDFITAATLPENERSAAQIERLKQSDALVEEVLQSDVIVLACPVYQFGFTTPLRAWADNIVRPGKTLTYSELHHKHTYGLLHNKLVVTLNSSGCARIYPQGEDIALWDAEQKLRQFFSNLGVRHFDLVTLAGVCEDDLDGLQCRWNKTEQEIDRLADRIRSRWKDRFGAYLTPTPTLMMGLN